MADNNDGTSIEIKSIVRGMEEILKPSDRPVLGQQRLVPFISIQGIGEFPVIWTSPYTIKSPIEENGPPTTAVVCLVLISKGPPKPDIICITIRPEDLAKCRLAPVEW